jgi:hypothetical protein
MGQLHTQISDTNQTTNTIRHELALLRSDLAGRPKSRFNGTRASVDRAKVQGKSTKSRISKKQSMVSRIYSGLLGKLLIRTVSESTRFINSETESPEMYSTSTSSWAFMPSFCSRYVAYQSFKNCGFIQRALRIYPLIPNEHPIWLMCSGGDIKGLQELLSARQVSPFSVDEYGRTLLHVCHCTTPSKNKAKGLR